MSERMVSLQHGFLELRPSTLQSYAAMCCSPSLNQANRGLECISVGLAYMCPQFCQKNGCIPHNAENETLRVPHLLPPFMRSYVHK